MQIWLQVSRTATVDLAIKRRVSRSQNPSAKNQEGCMPRALRRPRGIGFDLRDGRDGASPRNAFTWHHRLVMPWSALITIVAIWLVLVWRIVVAVMDN